MKTLAGCKSRLSYEVALFSKIGGNKSMFHSLANIGFTKKYRKSTEKNLIIEFQSLIYIFPGRYGWNVTKFEEPL